MTIKFIPNQIVSIFSTWMSKCYLFILKLYYKGSFFYWWLAKKKPHLSQEQIKIRILAYLYNKGEDGANSYTIQRKANIPSSQEYNRFKGFLDYLQNNSEKITYIGKRTMDNDWDIPKEIKTLVRNPEIDTILNKNTLGICWWKYYKRNNTVVDITY